MIRACFSDTPLSHVQTLSLCTVDGSSDTQPRKVNGSSVEAPSYQNLHRELLLSHKRYVREAKLLCLLTSFVPSCDCAFRGLVLEEKPELKRVLEQRRLVLHRDQEMAQQRPSDLETELRKRQQKLQEVRSAKEKRSRYSPSHEKLSKFLLK